MNGVPTHWYDIVMVVVLAGTTMFGAWKGVAWQLASLGSLVVSTLVAIRFNAVVAPWISREEWGRFVAMLILYLGTSLVIWLLFRPVAGFIDRLKLKEWDRQAGGLFGLIKGVLLSVVITFFAVTLSEDAPSGLEELFQGSGGNADRKGRAPIAGEGPRCARQIPRGTRPEAQSQDAAGFPGRRRDRGRERTPKRSRTGGGRCSARARHRFAKSTLRTSGIGSVGPGEICCFPGKSLALDRT